MTLLDGNLHLAAQASVERLLNCLVEGTAIALFAWLLLRMIGRRNSGTRFAVWFCALVAIAIAPLVELSSSSAAMQASGAAVTIPHSWSLYLFGTWAAIAFVGLARVAAGLSHLRSMRRQCVPVDPATLDPMVAKTLEAFGDTRRIELCASTALNVPTAIGFFRPAVVLPAWALDDLSAVELNAVVLHELAHLQRRDDWTNLAQKVLRALFFFHPAVWWVESRVSLEREMACDDLVLAQTTNPRAYAECLVSLAEKNLLRRGIALAQAAVGRMRQTSLRVLQILDAQRPNGVNVWKPATWMVAGFSMVALLSAAHTPKLVAFDDARAATVAHTVPTTSLSDEAPAYMPPVVPASFKLTDGKPATPRKAQRALASKLRVGVAHGVAQARSAQVSKQKIHEQSPSVRVLQASATDSAPVVVMQQAVFVVVQDPSSGDFAPVMWRVSVWRVTVVPSVPRSVEPQVSSKST